MAGTSNVDRAAMSKAVGQLEEKVQSITSTQSTLGSQINGLIGSGWSGNAATAFLRAFEDFNGQFTKVLNALDEIKNKLQFSLGHYSSTEQEQTQTATSSINAALNQ